MNGRCCSVGRIFTMVINTFVALIVIVVVNVVVIVVVIVVVPRLRLNNKAVGTLLLRPLLSVVCADGVLHDAS